MVRDECPGTAAALREACDEHISMALRQYDHMTDDEKREAHEASMVEFEGDLSRANENLETALKLYKDQKTIWTGYKKNPPKMKPARTRANELRQLIEPLLLELATEEAAEECDRLRRDKARATRMLNLEKKFTLI
jgi:hypothetical protein